MMIIWVLLVDAPTSCAIVGAVAHEAGASFPSLYVIYRNFIDYQATQILLSSPLPPPSRCECIYSEFITVVTECVAWFFKPVIISMLTSDQ
nr:hypothetical protein SPSIL_34420 [Sporomusa silvacetica DSM 10669]